MIKKIEIALVKKEKKEVEKPFRILRFERF